MVLDKCPALTLLLSLAMSENGYVSHEKVKSNQSPHCQCSSYMR